MTALIKNVYNAKKINEDDKKIVISYNRWGAGEGLNAFFFQSYPFM